LKVGTQASADTRVLISAALIGSGVGMALGAAYLAGGMAQAATDYSRASRVAEAAAGAYSEAALQREAGDPMVLRLTRSQDTLRSGAVRPSLLTARLDESRSRLDGSTRSGRPSANELECLTQAVYFEARGETPRGQAAVAQVVLNRVKHPAFPKTVCGVVFQGAARRTGCQFSFACDGSMRRGREASAWTRARKVAARALSGVALPEVGAATHFHTAQVSPNWGPRMRRVAQVGLHVFYRFNPRGYAPAPARTGDVMLASLQAPPTTPLATEFRLAAAMVGHAADAVDQATVAPAPAVEPAADAKPAAPAPDAVASSAKPPVKAPESPPAGLSKATEVGASSHTPADTSVS
jgi:spore germination cell wall hydrolase CwlJ-like protein